MAPSKMTARPTRPTTRSALQPHTRKGGDDRSIYDVSDIGLDDGGYVPEVAHKHHLVLSSPTHELTMNPVN